MKRINYDYLSSIRKLFDTTLTSLNIKIKDYDRLHYSLALIDKANIAIKAGHPVYPKYPKKRVELLYAFQDISELSEILNSLPFWNPTVARNKIKLYLKGVILPSEENLANNTARNIGFELWLASLLHNKGYKVDISDKNPDISAFIGSRNYLFECKRIYQEAGIEGAVRESVNQLCKMSLDNNNLGVIAISMSKIIKSTEDLMLISKNEGTASNYLYNLQEQFILKYQHLWKKHINKNIAGVFIHFSCIGAFVEENIPFYSNFITVNNIGDNDIRFYNLSKDFYQLSIK